MLICVAWLPAAAVFFFDDPGVVATMAASSSSSSSFSHLMCRESMGSIVFLDGDAYQFLLANTLFSCNIENGTSEQSSRVQAMENRYRWRDTL